jgi:tripartite-type tricarboxylate transporter receptor subunit TctC
MKIKLQLSVAFMVAALSLSSWAAADDVKNFYSKNDVTLIISSGAGGGYDTLGRLLARHLPKHIPGSPNIIVQNMPGAGGIVATSYLYNRADKDGSVIGGIQNNAPFERLFGNKVDFESQNFNWLGTPSVETGVVLVWHEVPINSIQDLVDNAITVASSGVNSTPSFYTRLLNDILGTQIRDIAGYKGQADSFLAMERREVDGYPSVFYGSLMSTRSEWVKDGKVKLLLQYGPQKEEAISDVPYMPELVKNKEDLALLEVAFAPLALGRPYLMPPGVPKDRVAAMQAAFEATFADPEFLKEANSIGLSTGSPRTGAEIQEFMARVFATEQRTLDRLIEIYRPK